MSSKETLSQEVKAELDEFTARILGNSDELEYVLVKLVTNMQRNEKYAAVERHLNRSLTNLRHTVMGK